MGRVRTPSWTLSQPCFLSDTRCRGPLSTWLCASYSSVPIHPVTHTHFSITFATVHPIALELLLRPCPLLHCPPLLPVLVIPPPYPTLCPPTVAVNLAKLKLFRHYYIMVGVLPSHRLEAFPTALFPQPKPDLCPCTHTSLSPANPVPPGHLLYLLYTHHRHSAASGGALPMAVAVPGEQSGVPSREVPRRVWVVGRVGYEEATPNPMPRPPSSWWRVPHWPSSCSPATSSSRLGTTRTCSCRRRTRRTYRWSKCEQSCGAWRDQVVWSWPSGLDGLGLGCFWGCS